MRRLIASLLCLGLGACSAVAPVESVAASEADLSCTAERAEAVSLRELIADGGKRWNGCVRVRGTVFGDIVAADVDAIYQRRADSLDMSSNGGALQLQWDYTDKDFVVREGESELIGRLGSCEADDKVLEALRARDPNPHRILWLSGYCHSFRGYYFALESQRVIGPVSWERQLPARAAPDCGDIEPARADWPHRMQAETLAQAFLAALRAGDVAKISALHDNFADLEGEDGEPEGMLRFMMQDARSPFAALRTSTHAPQLQVFYVRMSAEDIAAYGEDLTDRPAFACFCREDDCTRVWPINSGDTVNAPGRPYACTDIIAGVENGETSVWLGTWRSNSGLIEPRP